MEESVENNKGATAIDDITGKKLGGVTGKGFMPGVSGNPGGRPKGTMKGYLSKKFMEMSDEDKERFLIEHSVSGKDQIEFGEGKPKQDVEVSGELTSKVINIDE